MRGIEVDVDVFSEIWRRRLPGEETENAVLRRVLLSGSEQLGVLLSPKCHSIESEALEVKTSKGQMQSAAIHAEEEMGKVRWVDDVRSALRSLGGQASLHEIYKVVEQRRRGAGRSVPRTVEAIIRRTLEDHSSDSANFKSDDLFRLLGRGQWGLR